MTKDNRHLLLFLVSTLVVTSAAYFTIVLLGWSPYAFPGLALFLLGGSAPTWIALLFVSFTYDKDQCRAYFRRLSPRLISGRWWAVIFLIFPALYVLVYAVVLLLGGSLPGAENLRAYLASPLTFPLVILLGLGSGPLSEEFGWRGFALDPLIKRFGRIPGTVVLGFIWGIWHIGLFFMPQTWHGQMGFRFAGFFSFVLASIGLALVMTWVHVNTHSSILAAILMHYMNNFTGTALFPQPDLSEIVRMVLLLVVGFGLCLALERKSHPQTAVPVVG